MHPRSIATIAVWALVTFSLTDCSSFRQRRGSRVQREKAFVEVENQGFADMTVYVVDGSNRVRLGLANGHTTTKLNISSSLVGAGRVLRFLCDPVGSSRTEVTQEVFV